MSENPSQLNGRLRVGRDALHVWRAVGMRVRREAWGYSVASRTIKGLRYRVQLTYLGGDYYATCSCPSRLPCRHAQAAAIVDEQYYGREKKAA